MNKEPKTITRIRFPDCDPFGHLNNASYLHYLLNARDDHLRKEYGLDMYELSAQLGKSWVVGKTEIVYKSPAIMNEEVVIQSRLIESHSKWVKVELTMMNKEESHVKALMWGTFIHFNLKSQKSTCHDKKLIDLFNQITVPVSELNIDERLKTLS